MAKAATRKKAAKRKAVRKRSVKKKAAKRSTKRTTTRRKKTSAASKHGGGSGASGASSGAVKPPVPRVQRDLFGQPMLPTIGELMAKYRRDPNSLTVPEFEQLQKLQRAQEPKNPADVTVEFAAELLGCSQRNVKELRQAKKILSGGRARIDLRSICTYLREYQDKRYKHAAEPDDESLDYYKRECMKLRSELMEIDLEKERAGLVDAKRLKSQFREAGNRLRMALEAVERQHGQAIGDTVRDAIDEAYTELGMHDGRNPGWVKQ